MTDYSNSVIYKIAHKYNYVYYKEYIGSTNNFRLRKNRHFNNVVNKNSDSYNTPLYQYIRNSGGIHNWVIYIIENYNCNSKEELKEREKYWIKIYKSDLNITTPNQSRLEWARENVDRCRETQRRFYHNNLEKEKERSRIVYEKYKHLHKDKRNEREKERYKNNKEVINAVKAEKITCDNCGSIVRKGDIAKHKKTKKCLNYNVGIN